MTTFREFSQSLAVPVALVMLLSMGPVPAAHAAMVSTENVIEQSQVAGNRERVLAFLAREDIRTQMETMGVNPSKAAERVAGLSDSEVMQIVDKLDQLPAGQDAGSAIIGAVFAILIILLITDILCLTTFYPFTKCVTRR